MSKLKLFVHVRKDGNQIFYKGDSLSVDVDERVVKIEKGDDAEIVAVVFLAESESVGEYFKVEEKDKQ